MSQSAQADARVYSVNSLLETIERRARCPRSSDHRGFEYICTHGDAFCDKLVCIDCLRSDPSHFNAHSKYFVRVRTFLEQILLLSDRYKEKNSFLNIFQYEAKIRTIVNSYEDSTARIEVLIKAFFEKVYMRLVEILRDKVTVACNTVINSLRAFVSMDKKVLVKLLESAQDITKFSSKTHLVELMNLLESEGGNTNELRRRISRLCSLASNLDSNIQMTTLKAEMLSKLDISEFQPEFYSNYLVAHMMKFEPIYAALLDRLLPDSLDGVLLAGTKKHLHMFVNADLETKPRIRDLPDKSRDISHSQRKSTLPKNIQGEENYLGSDSKFLSHEKRNKRLEDIDKRIDGVIFGGANV